MGLEDSEIQEELKHLESILVKLEENRMFQGEFDSCDAFLKIQAGSGGVEAQDFANMLLRMYIRFCALEGFECELIEVTGGLGTDIGIKSGTLLVKGKNAFGLLRTETGVHRLVRKSPFDANNKRHTSFGSVYVSPVLDELPSEYENIPDSDLRIDTYRAQGAGGQHVNTTDSAVRITHIPTGVVVACQSNRSQITNRKNALKQLQSELFLLEETKKKEALQSVEDTKSSIAWGSQIRSYVMDDSRIKDLRTNYETRNTQEVLDGGIKEFVLESLKMNV